MANNNKQMKQPDYIAVFTRNHEKHLKEAARVCRDDPNRVVLFRSARSWVKPAKTVTPNNPIPIYFVPVDSRDGLITYVAQLVRVETDPLQVTDDEIRDFSVEATQNEGRWEETGNPTVETFYFIARCRKLSSSEHIHFTELRKYSDGEPIADNYGYSYVIVKPHPTLTV